MLRNAEFVILQIRLLAEHLLNLGKAHEIAQVFEFAEKCSRDIQLQSIPALPVAVNLVGKKVSSLIPPSVTCFRCGTRHYASDCKLKSVVFNHCGKQGHLAKQAQ